MLSVLFPVIVGGIVVLVAHNTSDPRPTIEVDGTLVRYDGRTGHVDIMDASGPTLASSVIPERSWVQAGPEGTLLYGDREQTSILHLDTGRTVGLTVDGSDLAVPSR